MSDMPSTVGETDWLGASSIRTAVSAMLVEEFNVCIQQLRPEALLDEDLCLDSLEMLNFALLLEDRFGIALSQDIFGVARTLQDLMDIVEVASCEKHKHRADQ